MTAACLEAFRITKDPFWQEKARTVFEWFLGRNDLGTPLYESVNMLPDDRYFDNLSGQQAYKCFACRVRKA